MNRPNPDDDVARLIDAVENVQVRLVGAMSADSSITLSSKHDGLTLREWLETLRVDIDNFLDTAPEAGRHSVAGDSESDGARESDDEPGIAERLASASFAN